jgi:hypothetical protein
MSDDGATPTGSWSHSHEEDGGGVQRYRPTHAFTFPPSRRGRETLEFGVNGHVLQGAPGPDDRQRSSEAVLTALGMNRYRIDRPDVAGATFELVLSAPDLIELRPL